MPRGSKPGVRFGGRKPGTPNKVTKEKAEALAATRQRAGLLSAVEVMAEAMNHFRGLAARYQPLGQTPDEPRYQKYLRLAADIAKDLAPYETPRMQATILRNDADASGNAVPLSMKIEVEYV